MNYNRIVLKVVLPLLILVSVSCVKYSFKGALPSYLETIHIVDFENKTIYANARETLLDLVTQGFISDNSLSVIEDSESADLILEGTISSVQKKTVSLTAEELVQSYEIVVNIRAECTNTHTSKALWSGTVSNSSPIDGDAVGAEIDAAIEDAIKLCAEDIITKTIAAW